MTERVMASVERIVAIDPIEGADKIVKATVKNWSLVTAIDNGFKVGDLVIYVEIDAWVPHDVAPFLSKGQDPREYNGVKGERLKTIKLRGQVSQGLILPLEKRTDEVLGEVHVVVRGDQFLGALLEGDDVSEFLGIQKWGAPIPACLAGVSKGNFPTQIPKTDEERVQNIKQRDWIVLNKHTYEVTEKLEGSSMTVARIDGEFNVCSRNMNLKEVEGNTFWKVARQYDIEAKMIELGLDNVAIQGELVGEGVQGNHYKLKGHDMFVFSMYDITKGEYIAPEVRRELVNKLGLKNVPVIGTFPMNVISAGLGLDQIQQVIDYADGQSLVNPSVLREGVVFKRTDGQEHFKAVSNNYLISTKL